MSRPGVNQRLDADGERSLRAYIQRCDNLGIPALGPQLKNAILNLADPEGRAHPIGDHWVARWLARNPDCRRVKQKPQELERMAHSTVDLYSDHFRKLKQCIVDHGIQPADCYTWMKQASG